MSGVEPTGYLSLRTMVPTGIAVWAIAFWLAYGPMVFAYLFLHAATTGVFLTAIRVADRNRLARQDYSRSTTVGQEPSHGRQPAVERAVAG